MSSLTLGTIQTMLPSLANTLNRPKTMATIITDEEQIPLSVGFTTSTGNPATIDGTPRWASSDEAVVTLRVAEDGLSAVAVSVGPLGMAQISVTADADLGEGVREITGILEIEVRAAEAVFVGITAGEPEAKTPGPEDEPGEDVQPRSRRR